MCMCEWHTTLLGHQQPSKISQIDSHQCRSHMPRNKQYIEQASPPAQRRPSGVPLLLLKPSAIRTFRQGQRAGLPGVGSPPPLRHRGAAHWDCHACGYWIVSTQPLQRLSCKLQARTSLKILVLSECTRFNRRDCVSAGPATMAGVQRQGHGAARAAASCRHPAPPRKIRVITCSTYRESSEVITLHRTDTTLDLSQKAEKGMLVISGRGSEYLERVHSCRPDDGGDGGAE
jgi:hypothetical protein